MKFKDIIKEQSKELLESGLSRIQTHMNDHDTGVITAYRSNKKCGLGEPYTKKENKQRNKSLLSKLKSKGYGIISAKGVSLEGDKEVSENSFFVIDLHDKNNLKNTLIKLGNEFEQDTILFIPKSGEKAILIGTNQCENNEFDYKTELKLNTRQLGQLSKFFTRVAGRPFLYESTGFFGKWSTSVIADKPWEELEIIDYD